MGPSLSIVSLPPKTEMQRWRLCICTVAIIVLFVGAVNLVVKHTRLRAYIFADVPVVGADAFLVTRLEK